MYLSPDGSAYVYGTFADSLCVVDAETFNVVSSWRIDNGFIQITIKIDNLGLGPNFSFIYIASYDAHVRPPPEGAALD